MTEQPPELLPCPFCGGEAHHSEDTVDMVGGIALNGGHYIYHIRNSGCRLDFTGYFRSKADAITAWNTRTDTAQDAEIARLRKALALAEHDQIDFLYECRKHQKETDNFRKKELRIIRADAVEDRLHITRAALTEGEG